MKRLYWIITILLFIPNILSGQEFSVKSFYLAETDLTAMTPGTQVNDQNGNPCALIKVESTDDDFMFEVGILGIRERKRNGAEIWLYVPYGIRKLTVNHPKLGVIRDYPLPPIDKGRTYILKFNGVVNTRISDPNKKQKLILQVHPDTARVEINGIHMDTKNGAMEKELSFGIWELKVGASRYHAFEQLIEINDTLNPHRFDIRLKPQFGWLRINGTGDETLTIDEEPYTLSQARNLELMSGHYQIRMTKPLHKPFERTIEITDSTVFNLTPEFEVNYKEVDLRVPGNADIYIDSAKVGSGEWKGKLEYGEHVIECRKDSHRSTSMTIEVEPMTLSPIMLEAPVPIMGILNVPAAPAAAEVYVDGKLVGRTPCSVEVLIGSRTVEVKKSGFVPSTSKVTIKEGETTNLNIKLSDILPVTIKSLPSANVQIDGRTYGKTPYTTALAKGEHQLVLKARGYYDMKKTFNVNEAGKVYSYKLKRRYFYPGSFYFGGEYQAIGYSAVKGTMGFCVKNFNVEGGFTYGFKSSETIYWNDLDKLTKPDGYQYTPMYGSLKLGYAFTLGSRLRVIPQAGAGLLMLKGEKVEPGSNTKNIDKGSCIPFNASMRFDIALAPHFAITLVPNYLIPIYSCELYEKVSNASSTINSYGSGLSGTAGLSIFF